MTTHSWGEDPIGKWILQIHNDAYEGSGAKFFRWSLKLYGTDIDPNFKRPEEPTYNKSLKTTLGKMIRKLFTKVVG